MTQNNKKNVLGPRILGQMKSDLKVINSYLEKRNVSNELQIKVQN